MKKVDFYLLKTSDKKSAHLFACRLLEKAHSQNLRVFVQTTDPTEAQQLDELLWTFRDISFIPHHIHGDNAPSSIEIGCVEQLHETFDILLNLETGVREFFNHIPRIIEIVSQDESARTQSREKFRIYRDQGRELQTHTM